MPPAFQNSSTPSSLLYRLLGVVGISRALAETPSQSLDFLISVADKDICKLRGGALKAIEAWDNEADDEKLRQLLRHKEEKIRRAASLALGRRHDEKTCKILRQLAENDPHHGVRMAAMESLGEPSSAADVTTFRKVAAVATGDQSKRAVELLGAKQSPTTLDALRFLVEKAYSSIVKVSAARILLRHPADAPTITKLIVNSKDWRLRAVLAEECASINILQTLANDTAESVRTAALFSIGRLKTKTAYQWLTAAYRNGQLKSLPVIMEAIALSSRVEAFDFLRDVVETNSPGRIEALRAMTVLGNAESVNFLMKKALLWKPTGDEKEGEPSSSSLCRALSTPKRSVLFVRLFLGKTTSGLMRHWRSL
jgi:HEAT repeats